MPNYRGQDLPLHDFAGIRKQSTLKEAEEPEPDERTVMALKLNEELGLTGAGSEVCWTEELGLTGVGSEVCWTEEQGLTDELAARCVGLRNWD